MITAMAVASASAVALANALNRKAVQSAFVTSCSSNATFRSS
jgi:hypothetical protein